MKKLFSILLVFFMVCVAGTGMAAAERMSVSADIANIRSGPDTADAVIWKVEKYHPLNILQKNGDWYLFEDFEGDRGWIHKTLLTGEKTVVVKNDNCNVRTGPGTDHDIRFTVDKGVPFKVIEEKGKWLHIRHADGDDGWIHEALVW